MFERYLRADSTYMLHSRCGNTGVEAQRQAETEAEIASAMLRDATIRAIMGHADQAGVHVDTAASFLLSRGERP